MITKLGGITRLFLFRWHSQGENFSGTETPMVLKKIIYKFLNNSYGVSYKISCKWHFLWSFLNRKYLETCFHSLDSDFFILLRDIDSNV